MALGELRNRPCPCGANKKYKKCHWNMTYKNQLPKRNITEELLAKRKETTRQYSQESK